MCIVSAIFVIKNVRIADNSWSSVHSEPRGPCRACADDVVMSCTFSSTQQVSRGVANDVDGEAAAAARVRKRDKKAIRDAKQFCSCDQFQDAPMPALGKFHDLQPYETKVLSEGQYRSFYVKAIDRGVQCRAITEQQRRVALRAHQKCTACNKPEAPSEKHTEGNCACDKPEREIVPLSKLSVAIATYAFACHLMDADIPSDDSESEDPDWEYCPEDLSDGDAAFLGLLLDSNSTVCVRCRRSIASDHPALVNDDYEDLHGDFVPSGDDKWDEKRMWLRESGDPRFADI